MGHFVSATCQGEGCGMCYRLRRERKPATHKVGEEVAHDDPHQVRHNLTQYVCCEHYRAIMGDRACGIAVETVTKVCVVFSPGQATASFEYAPQREEFGDDAAFEAACSRYADEWCAIYKCIADGGCGPGCPDHLGARGA